MPFLWTNQRLGVLRHRYASSEDGALARHLGCTVAELQAEAAAQALAKNKAAFPRTRKMPRWTAAELAELRRLYAQNPNLEIARELGRSTKSVVSKASALGLRKSAQRLEDMGSENVALRRDRAKA